MDDQEQPMMDVSININASQVSTEEFVNNY